MDPIAGSITPGRRALCLADICDDSRLGWLLGGKRRERMARFAVDTVCELQAAGIKDLRDIRDVTKARMQMQFGSIWVAIAFAIIWELIKARFFS